ncbi:MAG: ThuA domain-containing protein [Thermoguttaceae bacterium]|nr:ThuA domain-containing protein [Thermoguttaceae bacterium]
MLVQCVRFISIIMVLTAFVSQSLSSEGKGTNQNGKIRVLLVTGGHHYEEQAFGAFFAQFPELEMEHAIVPKDRDRIAPGLEKEFDVLMLYDQDNSPITDKEKQNFVDLLNRGIGLFVLHHHLSAHQNWETHFDLIGGRDFWKKGATSFTFRGKEYPMSTFIDNLDIDIQIADPNHPITQGIGEFVIRDEAYGKCLVHPDAHVLLTSKHANATPQVAWTWKYGASPVFVNMLGHGPSAWNQPEFGKIFIQATRWLCENRPVRTKKADEGVKHLKPGLILSFDDCGNIPGWVAALPLFEKYNVKATFFINGPGRMTPEQQEGLKKLMAAGHAVGSHGVNHADSIRFIEKQGADAFLSKEIKPAHEALRQLGASPVSFAWPNGWNNDATDRAIAKYYRHARGAARRFPEKGSMAEENRFFTPVGQTTLRVTFPGHGLDNVTEVELERHIYPSLQRIKHRGELLTVYAHTISPSGQGLSVRPEILEKIFIRAKELGLEFYRFDDIP